MFPRLMSRPEPSADAHDPLPASDLAHTLESHVAAGFPPDLALDLVLNELVVRAADATHASGAALALSRGDEMVCRASTGLHAPDLGVPIRTRGGLSGVCVRTRQSQLSSDAESDPRVDAVVSRRLGIRSMLIVPVFEEPDRADAPLAGVLEVFSPLPNAFNDSSRVLLEEFARECVHIRQAAGHIQGAAHAPELFPPHAEFTEAAPGKDHSPDPDAKAENETPATTEPIHQPYEGWTLALGAVVIVAAVGVSFLIGSRIGWLRSQPSVANIVPAPVPEVPPVAPANTAAKHKPVTKPEPKATAKKVPPADSSDGLVVYEKGKVIFRMKPDSASSAPPKVASSEPAAPPAVVPHQPAARPDNAPVVPAAKAARISTSHAIWLSPEKAEGRLVSRVEPQYPADAVAAHRSGDVVLEVHVAENGVVSSVRTLSGDPVLAEAAAQAVRNWHYEPYVVKGRPAAFQTDTTLKFTLPN